MKTKLLKAIILVMYYGVAIGQGTWTQSVNFGGTGRSKAVAFSIGAKSYLGTGSDDATTVKADFWEFDPSLGGWTQKANYGGGAKGSAVGFSIAGKGYIGTGGTNAIAGSNDFWEYDPTTDTWTQKANFPGVIRYYAVGFSTATKGYLGGGEYAQNQYNDFYEYDPTNDTWTQKPFYPGIGKTGLVAFSIGNKGYVGIGNSGIAAYPNDFWEYDCASSSWSQIANFGGNPRSNAVGFTINSVGYVATGYAALNDVWKYAPAALGIEENSSYNSISVYPNPFSVSTILQTDKFFQDATLTVYNSLGQQVKQIRNIIGQAITLQRDNLPSGLYFLRMAQDNTITTSDKLVITDN